MQDPCVFSYILKKQYYWPFLRTFRIKYILVSTKEIVYNHNFFENILKEKERKKEKFSQIRNLKLLVKLSQKSYI